ncbi:MAG: hypothetical protein OZ921_08295 [Sorangiineae bacterium]|nr:hypothetical protein [Polyangiaceae bacterium]MEB2322499.1 hypothetical protein [Sorangiineae bacterium]
MKTIASTLTLLAITGVAGAASAHGFAEPPDGPSIARPGYDGQREAELAREEAPEGWTPRSSVRIHTGPTLRISSHEPDGGLYAAFDIGQRAAGVRLSGVWVRVGADRGLQQYGGELWLDFGAGHRLHPILGAGAAVARVDALDAAGEHAASTIGVGTLRGTLEYVLPIRDADARAGLDVIGTVPAIRGASATDGAPWLLVVATVGIGF